MDNQKYGITTQNGGSQIIWGMIKNHIIPSDLLMTPAALHSITKQLIMAKCHVAPAGPPGQGPPHVVLDPSCNLDIFGEEAIYMEVDKYNSIDELEPYSQNTMGLYNNDYAGKINGAFAKIPVNHANAFALYGDSKNFYLMNVTQFSPPIDRIMRLRFTFRYHDGRLVDFKWLPFNFSLEFNMLRDEQKRIMQVRVPQFYNFAS